MSVILMVEYKSHQILSYVRSNMDMCYMDMLSPRSRLDVGTEANQTACLRWAGLYVKLN